MTWPPEVYFENPLDQHVYQALFGGNIAEIVKLDKQGIDWKGLAFPPLYVSAIHRQTPIGDWLEAFFSKRFPETVLSRDSNILPLENQTSFAYNFSDFRLLMQACEQNNLELLQEYFCLGSQWHIFHLLPISEIIFVHYFELADQFLSHGTDLRRWPDFLYRLMIDEFDTLSQGDCLDKDALPRTEALLYVIKAGVELNYYERSYCSPTLSENMETVLDFTQSIKFEPIVTALLEAGAKTAAELLQEQLYCPLPFDPATAQDIPFSD
jgi:hypothetical protein